MSSEQDLLESLPPIFRDSPDYQEIMRVQGIFYDWMAKSIEDVLNQFFINHATWSLDIYEKEFGMDKGPPHIEDHSFFVTDHQTAPSPVLLYKPIEQRRSALLAKKKGLGTIRAKLIKDIAESFQNGSVEVQAIQEDSVALIIFNDVLGAPPNIEDIKKAIMEVLPFNYTAVFSFKYLKINEIHEVKTIAEMNAIPLDQFAGGG